MAQKKYFLTIDQGTSGTKALVFGRDGQLICRHDEGHEQFYPRPGWVEHDPEEIFANTLKAMAKVMEMAGTDSSEIICVSLSNQRETTLMWNRVTGKSVMNAVVWQCRRGEDICKELEKQGVAPDVKKKTGLVLSPYFSAAKARWIMDSHPGIDRENVLFGTMDSYLIWKLTGGAVHATDFSNASRTQLFNLQTLAWDGELLEMFHLDRSMMPEVRSSNALFGETAEGLFDVPIPLAGVLGDSHAAFFGQCCTERGMTKTTYGTGSSIMMNIGDKPIDSVNVVTSVGFAVDEEVVYVLEGNVNCTGATVKWLVDDIELFSSSKEVGVLAASVEDNQGVYLVPALTGLSAPHWNSDVRAVISNMSRGTKKAHIARAAEESIVFQIMDVINAMGEESGIRPAELRVDGGPTRDDFLMQFQADMLNAPVTRTKIEELSATGAMYMGGLALKVWNSVAEIGELRVAEKTFRPEQSDGWREKNYSGWQRAVRNLIASER
ncbi:MAG: glycerol kinase GlpK [Spirochaetales bacterium]|nr:glycerol kinase GlpK [Spirochaetales bacterium]